MKNIYLIIFSINFLTFQSSLSQSFKEVKDFHENGNPKIIVFKNTNLQITKKQEFDFENVLLTEFNYNPETGVLHGEFKDFNNVGFYNNGELNCTNCMISMKEGTQFRGEFKNGRPIGEVEVYEILESQIRQTNIYMSYLLSLEYRTRIKYDEMVGTGKYIYEKKLKLKYNSNGNLDGPHQINNLTKLYFEDGKMVGFTINNQENQYIKKDSIFRDNKIWLTNNEFKKNTGWIDYYWEEFDRPWIFNYNIHESYGKFFGGKNTVIDRGSDYRQIGIEYKNNDENFWKKVPFSEENLIYLISLYIKSFNEPLYFNGLRYIGFYYHSSPKNIINQFKVEDYPGSQEHSILNFFEVEKFLVNTIKHEIFEDVYYYESGKYKSFKELIMSNKLGDNKRQIESERIQVEKIVLNEINFFENNVEKYFNKVNYHHNILNKLIKENVYFVVEKFPEEIKKDMIEKGGVDEYYEFLNKNEELYGKGFLFLDESELYFIKDQSFQDFFSKDKQWEFMRILERLLGNLVFHYGYNDFLEINKIQLKLNESKNDYSELILTGEIILKPIIDNKYSYNEHKNDTNQDLIKIYKNMLKNKSTIFNWIINLDNGKVKVTDESLNLKKEFSILTILN